MNTMNLIGRLVNEPESKVNGEMIFCKYKLAVSRGIKVVEGKQDTDFITCSCMGKTAEFAQKYFRKGIQIGVVGKLRINEYKGENGENKYATEVFVTEQYFADKLEKNK